MYLWKIKALKEQLKKGSLSQEQQLKYLLAYIILGGLATIPFFENNIWDVYLAVIVGAIDIIGLIYIYQMNGGSKGKYILQRLISLDIVFYIRFTLMIALPALIIFYGVLWKFFDIHEATAWYDIVPVVLLSIPYYWLLGRHVKEVAAFDVKENL